MTPELNPNVESLKVPLRVRRFAEADLPFADSVRALAGWNQTRADWVRFRATEPDGCFLGEWDGTSAGTATTTVYGTMLAWIGMVLVHPDFRRRGIGTALLRRCLDYLRERNIPCLKLDATPAGRPVYLELGFQDEWTLTRWAGPVKPSQQPPPVRSSGFSRSGRFMAGEQVRREQGASQELSVVFASLSLCEAGGEGRGEGGWLQGSQAPEFVSGNCLPTAESNLRVRPWQSTDLPRVEALDTAAFGVSRQRLLAALAPQSLAALVVESQLGDLAGYGFLRPGSRALYLGPVVAASPVAGLLLVEALVARSEGQTIFWDIPDQNTAAVAWATDHGLTSQRPLTRMFLGRNLVPGLPSQLFALAGPEVG